MTDTIKNSLLFALVATLIIISGFFRDGTTRCSS